MDEPVPVPESLGDVCPCCRLDGLSFYVDDPHCSFCGATPEEMALCRGFLA
jgi:hypothetical protein